MNTTYNRKKGRITAGTSKNIKCFTLIEVTMAIAVVAIGLVGVLALFPVGFQASRNAIGDYYSSQMADSMLHIIAIQAKTYVDSDHNKIPETDGWSDYVIGSTIIPDLPPDTSSVSKGTSFFNGSGTDPLGIYNGDKTGTFYMEILSGDVVDFSAAIGVWKEPVTFDSSGGGTNNATIPEEVAKRLMLEISWPLTAPYDKREKRYYTLDIFNNIPRN